MKRLKYLTAVLLGAIGVSPFTECRYPDNGDEPLGRILLG